jgi:Pterin binding enzyme
MRLRLPRRLIEFPRRPLVMGIVNVNDDSFSGDGTLDFETAVALARSQVAAGADVIDVGAESARTNRAAVPVAEELRRFRGFIERWEDVWTEVEARDETQVWPPVLSANTWRPEVVEGVLRMGKVEIINDMGALPDDRNAKSCALHGAALLIMHSVGEPKVPHFSQQWACRRTGGRRGDPGPWDRFREAAGGQSHRVPRVGTFAEIPATGAGSRLAKDHDRRGARAIQSVRARRRNHRLHQRGDEPWRTDFPRPSGRGGVAGGESAGCGSSARRDR